ncbi:hypothetical protein SEVIR_2G069650v4 [Setaria viridis]
MLPASSREKRSKRGEGGRSWAAAVSGGDWRGGRWRTRGGERRRGARRRRHMRVFNACLSLASRSVDLGSRGESRRVQCTARICFRVRQSAREATRGESAGAAVAPRQGSRRLFPSPLDAVAHAQQMIVE